MKRTQPFSNASEFGVFLESNCEDCRKAGEDYAINGSPCPLLEALLDAEAADGTIQLGIAKRIGFSKSVRMPSCKEKESL